jgi:hypothetical protein
VTGFEFRLHPFGPDILSVDLAYRLDDGPAAIHALLALAEDAPDALTVGGAVVTARPSAELPEAFHGAPVVWVSYVYADDVETGKRFVPRLRAAGEPLLELVVRPGQRLPSEPECPALGRLIAASQRDDIPSLIADRPVDQKTRVLPSWWASWAV